MLIRRYVISNDRIVDLIIDQSERALYFCQATQMLFAPLSGWGYSTKFYTGWLRPEGQSLTLLSLNQEVFLSLSIKCVC